MTRKQTSAADRKRYDVLNQMLRDRQAEIQNKLRSLRQILPAEVAEVKDTEEQSMEDFVRGMDFALMQMESETLRKIDEALLRLQAGTYGVCAQCDTRIGEPRLRALPFASLCRDCQEHEEEATRTNQPRVHFEADPAAPARGRRPAGQQAEKPRLGPWGVRAAQNA
ncbi:MAG TPA: TraR/DksA family transcriptional regulator [Vicinamibacteria bacterium]|nr:TraR/DksA family transcriptional regulator [Vicinamibacteria bacterium]